jgi:hypothetical protein
MYVDAAFSYMMEFFHTAIAPYIIIEEQENFPEKGSDRYKDLVQKVFDSRIRFFNFCFEEMGLALDDKPFVDSSMFNEEHYKSTEDIVDFIFSEYQSHVVESISPAGGKKFMA